MNVKTHPPMPQHLYSWSIFGYCRSCTKRFDAYTTIKNRHSSFLIYLSYIIPLEDIQQKYWKLYEKLCVYYQIQFFFTYIVTH